MKKKTFVLYRGKSYELLGKRYLGFDYLYKLASRNDCGSPFGAHKDECRLVAH